MLTVLSRGATRFQILPAERKSAVPLTSSGSALLRTGLERNRAGRGTDAGTRGGPGARQSRGEEPQGGPETPPSHALPSAHGPPA